MRDVGGWRRKGKMVVIFILFHFYFRKLKIKKLKKKAIYLVLFFLILHGIDEVNVIYSVLWYQKVCDHDILTM